MDHIFFLHYIKHWKWKYSTKCQHMQLPQNWLSTLGMKSEDCLKRHTEPRAVRICSHLARRKLTSSTWESSDGWHHGEPIHCTNSPPVTSQRVSSPPCWRVCLLFSGTEAEYVCVFSPGPAIAQNTIETHQRRPPQAPLDVTLVTMWQ